MIDRKIPNQLNTKNVTYLRRTSYAISGTPKEFYYEYNRRKKSSYKFFVHSEFFFTHLSISTCVFFFYNEKHFGIFFLLFGIGKRGQSRKTVKYNPFPFKMVKSVTYEELNIETQERYTHTRNYLKSKIFRKGKKTVSLLNVQRIFWKVSQMKGTTLTRTSDDNLEPTFGLTL